MPKKVLCTGLGYIGFQVCKEFLGKDYQVTVIDNQIFPDRIKWCQKYGIKFYKRDLFELRDLLQDVEILIHTAGITLVPNRIEDDNPEINSQIHKVGTLGTREIIKNTNPKTKLIFLSTHVLYENLQGQNDDITESVEPCPLLAYSTSKFASENDLYCSNSDFVILRLGSVFGYNKAIRWKIVTNLFPLKAALGEKIKVMGAKVPKPVVGISDVAKVIKFLAESNYSREIFHILSEHKTIGEMAEICRKFAPNLEIEYSNEIMSQGYTLSNNKILNTGFKFTQSLEEEMLKMYSFWKT